MKKIILLCFYSIFILNLYPQNREYLINIDTVKVRCLYRQFSVADTTSQPRMGKNSYMYLQVGNKVSKYFSFDVAIVDSLSSKMISENKSDQEIMQSIMSATRGVKKGDSYTIYKNYPRKNSLIYDESFAGAKRPCNRRTFATDTRN